MRAGKNCKKDCVSTVMRYVVIKIIPILHRNERCQHSNACGSSIAVWERTNYCAHLNLHCPHSNLSCLLHFFVHKVTVTVRTATSVVLKWAPICGRNVCLFYPLFLSFSSFLNILLVLYIYLEHVLSIIYSWWKWPDPMPIQNTKMIEFWVKIIIKTGTQTCHENFLNSLFLSIYARSVWLTNSYPHFSSWWCVSKTFNYLPNYMSGVSLKMLIILIRVFISRCNNAKTMDI